MNENVEELASHFKARFEGVEVIDPNFTVCVGHICDHFGGCANCQGMMVANEVDENGVQAGLTRLFLCTHWCHSKLRHTQ